MSNLKIGCHVSAAGGVWNAPKNAHDLACETFQIFTRPPMGGPASKIDDEAVEKFKAEMEKYFPATKDTSSVLLHETSSPKRRRSSAKNLSNSPLFPLRGRDGDEVNQGFFVVHCPYFVNFGSAVPRIYHGSISVVAEELKRANSLGAKFVMTHLGSSKDLGDEKAFAQTKKGLTQVLKKYEGETQFLLEIAAGAGSVIGDTFEDLADLMDPLLKFKTFGGICFDTQHAFSSGYDLRDDAAVASTFKKFDKIIGLKYLRMSHINDSKVDLAGHKDRHEHLGDGKIGVDGFKALLEYLSCHCERNSKANREAILTKKKIASSSDKALTPRNDTDLDAMPLILETEHDKVKSDIKILKSLRDKM